MNQDKAREFFSAYYEGSLEPGLLQSVETRLKSDATLQADYSAFVATMKDLSSLDREEIEVPIFLSDRIATRLEAEMAKRKSVVPAWAGWVRGLAFAGLGALAIGGAILSMRSSGGTKEASTVPTLGVERPSFMVDGDTVAMNFHPSSAKTVVVSSAVSGREMERFNVDSASTSHSFANSLDGTALFQIRVTGDSSSYMLALPGVGMNDASGTSSQSSGTIKDFAVAFAGRYRMPVLLRATDTDKHLNWKLGGSDEPVHAAATALGDAPYVAEQRESGILYIGDR